MGFLPWLLGLLVLALYLNRNRPRLDLMRALAYALAGNGLFAYTFSAVKTTLPLIVPYYADPFFARLDKGVHFGVDPWVLTHKLSAIIPPDLPQLVYYDLWFLPALFFPMFLVLLDNNPARVARFLVIYVFVWVGLGNIVALIGMSGGPVYFERLTGLQDFTELSEALQSTGLADANIGRLQDLMWRYLAETKQLFGAGISAFPSVHVGVAAVIAVYAYERHCAAGLLFGLYVLIVLFLSVYLGWHYAIDGYFSIAVVLGLWRLRWSPNIASIPQRLD